MHNGRSGCRVKPTDTLYKPWNLATEPFCSPCTTDSNLPELLVNHIAGDFADTDSEAESKLSISSIVSDDIDDISTVAYSESALSIASLETNTILDDMKTFFTLSKMEVKLILYPDLKSKIESNFVCRQYVNDGLEECKCNVAVKENTYGLATIVMFTCDQHHQVQIILEAKA